MLNSDLNYGSKVNSTDKKNLNLDLSVHDVRNEDEREMAFWDQEQDLFSLDDITVSIPTERCFEEDSNMNQHF